jgi:hypothetical protein
MIKNIFIFGFTLILTTNIFAKEIKKNSITSYYGVATDNALAEIVELSIDVKNPRFVGITYNRNFYQTKKLSGLSLEYEIGGYEHFGNFGAHQEGTISILARFNNLFPKNFFIESFAVGEGLSLASSDPSFEAHIHTDNDSNDFLNYLAFELVFKLPKLKDTKFVSRIHHRSGVYGLFDGIRGGSNYFSFGIRKYF